MGLLRARRKMAHLERGVSLLEKKRQALVRELFQRAHEVERARGSIAEAAAQAYPVLLEALAEHGADGLSAMAEPLQPLELELEPVETWGVVGAEIVRRPTVSRSIETTGVSPGSMGPAAAETARRFELLVDRLIEAASRELLLRRLGRALAETSRQIGTLERRVEPDLRSAIAAVRSRLDEREREEHLRLRRLRR
jgi:V/A-type H+/Na+-transporting ATPase subunit D